jgi:uncharacterized protein YndB with AHSA1/START domain
MRHRPVSVSRAIAVPPGAVFAILADPRRHPEIDGSGLGSTFGMAMRQYGARYEMANEVTEFEPDRRIAWRAFAKSRGGPKLGGATWRYQLRPTEVGCLVTETYDITTGTGSRVMALLGMTDRMERAMVATLDRLAAAVDAP